MRNIIIIIILFFSPHLVFADGYDVFGIGYYDIKFDGGATDNATDIRYERRFDKSLLQIGPENYDFFDIKPFVGFEGTSDSAAYFLVGIYLDDNAGTLFTGEKSNILVTPSFGFGYYEEGDGKKSGDSFTSNYPHTSEMWQAHLEGKKFKVKTNRGSIEADSLGLCPINKNSKCRWGAMDLDNYKPSIPELFKKLKSLNVPTIPFRSKSGGIHLYIFLTEEVPALLMREKLHSIKNILPQDRLL